MASEKISIEEKDFDTLVAESRQKAISGNGPIVGHFISIHHDTFVNHEDISTWARRLNCKVETYPGVTIIEIVPFGYRKDIFPE